MIFLIYSDSDSIKREKKVVLNFFFFFYCYFRFDSFNVVIVQYKIYIRTSAHSQMIKCRKKFSRSCLHTVSRAANTQQIGCDNFLAQALCRPSEDCDEGEHTVEERCRISDEDLLTVHGKRCHEELRC